MSRFERDTLMRQIRQMADAIAALLLRARVEGDYESGLEAVREAAERGLGVGYRVIDRLAPPSAAMLLRGAEIIRAYAWVCGEEADLLARAGRDVPAAARRRRAIELYHEAAAREPAQDGECRLAAAALAVDGASAGLDQNCRRWLGEIGEQG